MMQQPERPSFCVLVVPCFNEAQRLPVNAFLHFLTANPAVLLLFVNDGSSDGTLDILEGIRTTYPAQVEVLDLPQNRGKAEATRQGVLLAIQSHDPLYVGFWDADLATPLDEVVRFLNVMQARSDVDVLLGSRVSLLGRPVLRDPKRHYAGRMFATLASLVLELRIYDTQCGAKLFRNSDTVREIFAASFVSHWIFDVELIARYLLLHPGGQTVAVSKMLEEPVLTWHDVGGSKVKPKDGFRAFYDLLVIRRFIQRFKGKRRNSGQATT